MIACHESINSGIQAGQSHEAITHCLVHEKHEKHEHQQHKTQYRLLIKGFSLNAFSGF